MNINKLYTAIISVALATMFVLERKVDKSPVEQKVVELHMVMNNPSMPERLNKRGKIVTLPFGTATCSGAFIDGTGDIITARHCVNGFASIEVQTYDRRKYDAVVITTSAVHDLALIHIDRQNTSFFSLADNVVRGEKIAILGSPLGVTDVLSTGMVARLDGDLTLLDCAALPGNSGGPVFNQDHKLVGVVVAGFIVGLGTTHLNIAQSLDNVRFFLRQALRKKNDILG
jgi:S1-C subfamily serine protease